MKKLQSNKASSSSSSDEQLSEGRRTRGTDYYKFWNELKATVVDSEVSELEPTPTSSRESTPSSDGIPSIDLTEPVPQSYQPSILGYYHEDSPSPPDLLPPIPGAKPINDDKCLTRAEARPFNPIESSKTDSGLYDPHPPFLDQPRKSSFQRHYESAQRCRDAPPPKNDNGSPRRNNSQLFPSLSSADSNDGSSGKSSCETNPSKSGGLLNTDADLLHLNDSEKLSRYNVNVPISRDLIEQIEEPSRWKKQQAEKVRNAIDRVERNYVTNPRTYKEPTPTINERIDREFVPQPPPDPRPRRLRRNNRVITEPDNTSRATDCMRGDFVPGLMPALVQHSPSRSTGTTKPNLHRSQAYHQPMMQEQRLMEASDDSGPLDHDILQHNVPGQQKLIPLGLTYAPRPPANTPKVHDARNEWRKERELAMLRASQRVQHQYVDGLREEAELQEHKPKTGWDLEQEIRATHAEFERKESLLYWDRDPEGTNHICGHSQIQHFKQHAGYDKPQTDYGLARTEYGYMTRSSESHSGYAASYDGIAVKENTKADKADHLLKTTQAKIRIDATKNTGNATMSTKGVGFKSRLKKQQEEAALRNTGNDNIAPPFRDNRRIIRDNAPILRGTGSSSIDALPIIQQTGSTNNKPTQTPRHPSSDARKYWKHKTIG